MQKYLIPFFLLGMTQVSANENQLPFYVKFGVGQSYVKDVEAKHISDGGTFRRTMETNFDSSNLYNIGVGYKVNKFFNLELNYLNSAKTDSEKMEYRFNGTLNTNRYYNSTLKSQALMLTALFDIAEYNDFDWKVRPYIGAGIGVSKNTATLERRLISNDSLEYFSKKEDKYNFAYKGTIGAVYDITNNIALDLSYSLADYGRAKAGKSWYDSSGNYGGEKEEAHNHDVISQELLIAIRYSF